MEQKTILDEFMQLHEAKRIADAPHQLRDGDNIIPLTTITAIEEVKAFSKEGERPKYKYHIHLAGEEKPIVIPERVLNEIFKYRKEYGIKLIALKVRKSGQALSTRYDCFPVLGSSPGLSNLPPVEERV